METSIGILGSLGILALIVIAGVVCYILIARPGHGKSGKETQSRRSRSCPICGGRMEDNPSSQYIIYCTTPNCPNSRHKTKKPDVESVANRN